MFSARTRGTRRDGQGPVPGAEPGAEPGADARRRAAGRARTGGPRWEGRLLAWAAPTAVAVTVAAVGVCGGFSSAPGGMPRAAGASPTGGPRPDPSASPSPGDNAGNGPLLSSVRGSVPWPKEGEASAEIEGVGSLGTSGTQTPVPIASVAKVMTAYVVLQDHPLAGDGSGPVVTVDREAADESGSADQSTVPVRAGTQLTERRLLELMLVPSGNNIARLLARWDAGSEQAFVTRMNRAAKALGMTRTDYTGASGIEATTVSTAADQLLLARKVMQDEVFRAVVAEPGTDLPGAGGTIPNTNTLLGQDGVVGLKTGSSTPAGGALMWAAVTPVEGRSRLLLGVVLHQRANSSPEQGLEAALGGSRTLIEGIERALGADPASAPAPTVVAPDGKG